MDAEQMDTTDIGVDDHTREIFKGQVSLASPVSSITQQESALESEVYQKKEPKEGDCHIFYYQEFNNEKLAPRMGSEKDAARLKHDFTQLNLDVHLHDNLSHEETFNILNEASNKDYPRSKYFICCFLTHGNQTTLWAKDRTMNIDDILSKFSESTSLKEIPKIFIIQACRGNVPEEVVLNESTDSGFLTDTQDYLDFLIVNSTYLDTVSFKTSDEDPEKSHGSFFIDEFCHSLEQFSSQLDLLQILTIVNYSMANTFLSHHKENTEIDKKKQMPCFTSTLRKKVEFNRKIEQFISSDTQYFHDRRESHRSGNDSIDYCLPNACSYKIKMAERVLYLHIVDEQEMGKEGCEVQSAVNSLWGTFANQDYSRQQIQDKFKKSKIMKFLNQSSNQAKKLSKVDCLICYIAAYSRCDSVCDADGRKISKKEIVGKFIGQLNKSFVGKPKIFIFLLRKLGAKETLRGERFCENLESSIEFDTSTESSGRGFNTSMESTDGGGIGDNLIPIHADILEICITVSDWKHAIKPMDLFCKILEEKSASTDLLSLLTEFNCDLVEKHNFFQVPKKIYSTISFSVTSTLTKLLYLP